MCVYGVLFCTSVDGLDRDRKITQFHHTTWTAKEGAPEQIRTIAQTTDGYLWLGTETGLYRFDGAQFDSYVPRSGGDFPSKNIFSLLATPDGGLWIGYYYGGASFLKDGNLTNYGEPEGLPPGRILSFAKDDEGTIWVAAAGGLARLEVSHRWQQVGTEWNYPWKFAQTVFVDKAGTLWVAAKDTLMFLPKGTRSFQSTGEKIGQVLKITQSPDGGALWLAETTRAVRQMPLPGIEQQSIGPEIYVGSVAILFDRDGALWITSIGDGLRRLPYTDRFSGQKIAQFSTDAEIFAEKDGLSGNYIYTVFEDKEGNIWIGTANGLDRFRASPLIPIRFPSGYQDFGLAAGDNGEIWTGSSNQAANRIRGNTPPQVELTTAVSFIFRDEDGAIWMGAGNVIYRWYGGKFSRFAMPTDLNVLGISTIFKDRGGILWVYTDQEGAFQFKDGIWSRYERQAELPKSSPITGAIDSFDRKWFGYAAGKLTVIDGTNIRTFSQDNGLSVGDVKVIQERGGHLWVGGTLGVAVFEEDRFRMMMTEREESFSGVSGMVAARDGSLWLNSSRGVIHIPAEEVRLFLERPDYRVGYRVFDFLDGLPGAAQQNRPFPTAVEGSDGRLWFSATKGVAWIDPQQISRNTLPPPVLIRSVGADDKLYEPSPSLELPEGTMRLQINFTALSLSVPERVRFRFRLEGVDNEWQDPGNKRETTYTNLGPGNYRFRVIASNNDGVWNEEGAVLDFSIAPMFYQTLRFRVLIFFLTVLMTAFILYLLYRWRVRLVTERLNVGFEERLAERTRIAHELHDTLLQGFFGAAMRLQAVSNLLPSKSEKAKENLDNVLDQIDVVLEDGRRAIWDMNSSDAAEKDLGQAFTLVGEDLNKSYPANFSLTIEGQNRPLHPLVRDQIYRIGREALINAFRHSQATNIELEIEYAPKHLRLAVRDNGCGIQTDVLSAGREGHLGLSGMRKYAEKIGAELKIWSRAESGTEVVLIVPQKIAFEKKSSDGLLSRMSRFSSRKPRRTG
jgi:ligand-binding sensor domain-containing protein/signal transduction histidine kinase